MDGFTTVRLHKKTKKLLESIGKKNESYDSIICNVLEKTGVF